MIFQSMSHLKKYNYSNELKVYMMDRERTIFHQTCVFPYNILVLIEDDGDTGESYIYCKQTGDRLTLNRGNFYFVPTGMTVEYCLRDNVSFYTFHVGLEVNPGIDLFASYPRMISGKAGKHLRDVQELYQEKDEFRCLCRMRRLLLDFFIEHWPDAHPQTIELPEEFRDLMQYIKTQSDAKMTVKALADRIGMTPEAFSRKFRKLIRITPKDFIVKCLIEKITSRLCDSNKTIKEISRELGFSSEFYLSRFFSKHMKIPPVTYKRMVREKAPSAG